MRNGDNRALVDIPPVALPGVPDLPSKDGRAGWMAALPALGGLGAVGFLAMAPRSPFVYAAGALMVLVSVGLVTGSIVRARRERREGRQSIRAGFLRELDAVRVAIAASNVRARQKSATAVVRDGELHIPVSTTTLRRTTPPIEAGPGADPFCRQRLRQLVTRSLAVPEVPLAHAFGASSAIAGPPLRVRGVLRHLVRRVVLDLDPDQVRIAVLTSAPHRWRALRWAPHHRHPTLADEVGAARLVAGDATELLGLLELVRTPVLLVADGSATPTRALVDQVQWAVRAEGEPAPRPRRDGRGQLPGPAGPELVVDDDGGLRPGTDGGSAPSLSCTAGELEAACRAAAGRSNDPGSTPAEDAIDEPLRPVLGIGEDGHPVRLDIREAGSGGTGPHGMLIGVTGSGKSEVLRTIVSGLVSVHPPAELSMLLVDFKGGATFAPFERLAHTSAVITNLADDPHLVDRMRRALSAELRRRQHLLKDAGAASVDTLADGARPPRLLVVVDEFSELLTAHPAALDTLIQIGRLGRSLGVHLLIAAQRVDEGRLKGLDSHLTYRVALRTQSDAESRSVIGIPDAASLANAPGYGYLRRGSARPIAFRARFTGAPITPAHGGDAPYPVVLRYPNGPLRSRSRRAPTLLDAAVEAAAAMPGTRQTIWVPPPSRSPSHAELYPDLAERPGRGFGTTTGPGTSAAIGTVDRPDLQRIDVATVDLAAGHLALVGTTRSGTTTAAVTAVLSLALRNSPEQLNLYLVEPSESSLGELRGLPHVAAYAADAERIRATLRRATAIIEERQTARTVGVDPSLVVLAIDGYSRLRDSHESLDAVLIDVAQRGLAVGVHLVLTANRWMDLRPRLRELLGNRIELRLGDPIESEIDRRAAALVPRGQPGRGLTQDGHPLYVASTPTAALVNRIDRAWSGPRARGLAELPAVLAIRNLGADLLSSGLCLAVERSSGRAVVLPAEPPYCLVIGDPGSGRTSVLRSLGIQDARRGARLLVIDPRRQLLDDLPLEQQLGYAATPAAAADLISGLVTVLQRRMPPASITAQQLRQRSWWDGPPLHLIVDDHDLATLVGVSLGPLRAFLPYAAQIGLRVTIARRAAGAGAALHEETLALLRDLGCTALLLSRAVDEGPLLGARPGQAAWSQGILVTPARSMLDVQAVVEPPNGGG